MNAKTVIFIHVGFQKTGSTAIQTFLTNNRHQLLSQGMEYIDPARSKIGFQGHNHSHLALSLTGYWFSQVDQLTREEAWGELRKIAMNSENHIIVSSELLSIPQMLPHVGYIKESLRGLDVKIIFYLRRQDLLAQSIYKERVQNTESRLFQEAYAHGDYQEILDFKKTLEVWCQHFSLENIVIRPYEERQLTKGDVVKDFLSILGVEESAKLKFSSTYANSSENIHFLHISRELNSLLHPSYPEMIELKQWIRKQLDSDTLAPYTNQSITSPDSQIKILEKYCDDNEYIARKLLNRKDGFLFKDSKPDLGENWKPYTGLSAKEAALVFKNIFEKVRNI